MFSIEIRVRPNASRNKVWGCVSEPPRLIVSLQAPAVDGKANDAVVKDWKLPPASPREHINFSATEGLILKCA